MKMINEIAAILVMLGSFSALLEGGVRGFWALYGVKVRGNTAADLATLERSILVEPILCSFVFAALTRCSSE